MNNIVGRPRVSFFLVLFGVTLPKRYSMLISSFFPHSFHLSLSPKLKINIILSSQIKTSR